MMFEVFFSSLSSCVLVEFDDDDDDVVMMKQEEAMVVDKVSYSFDSKGRRW